jgi:hypothetical protein
MGYVAIGTENSPPIGRHSGDRGAGRPRARCGQVPARARSAGDDQRTTAAGGISLAAVLGGTLLRWGRGTHHTSPRRVAPRP